MKSLFKKKKDIAPLEDNIIELDKNKTTIPYKETGECISQNVLPLNAKIKEFRKTEISLLKPSFNLEKEGNNKKNIEDEILKQTPENFSQLISEEHLKIQKMLSSFEAEIDTRKMFRRYDERYFINFNFFDYILDDKEKIKDEIKKYIIILVNHLNSLKWKISSNYNNNYLHV